MHILEVEEKKETAYKILKRYGKLLKKRGHHKEKRVLLHEIKKLAMEIMEIEWK